MSWSMFAGAVMIGVLLGMVVTGYIFIYLFLERTSGR